MSKIAELGKDYKNLPTLLEAYETDLANARGQLEIKGKKLEIANSENSAWLHYYDQRKVELNTIVKFFQAEEERIRGSLFKAYKENYSLTKRGKACESQQSFCSQYVLPLLPSFYFFHQVQPKVICLIPLLRFLQLEMAPLAS